MCLQHQITPHWGEMFVPSRRRLQPTDAPNSKEASILAHGFEPPFGVDKADYPVVAPSTARWTDEVFDFEASSSINGDSGWRAGTDPGSLPRLHAPAGDGLDPGLREKSSATVMLASDLLY